MSPSMIGLVAGAILGIVNSFVILRVARTRRQPAARSMLKAVGLFDLVLMPALGWVIGTYVFGGAA